MESIDLTATTTNQHKHRATYLCSVFVLAALVTSLSFICFIYLFHFISFGFDFVSLCLPLLHFILQLILHCLSLFHSSLCHFTLAISLTYLPHLSHHHQASHTSQIVHIFHIFHYLPVPSLYQRTSCCCCA